MRLETILPSITSLPRSPKAKEVNWASQAAEILITQSQPEPGTLGVRGLGQGDGWMLVGPGEVVELSRRAGLGLGSVPSWVSHPAGWEQACEGGGRGGLAQGGWAGYKSPTQPSRAAQLLGRLSEIGARPR